MLTTMQDDVVELDVRALLDQGRSPLPLILNTAHTIEPGQTLRLVTSWEPLPLYDVLGQLGFSHSAEQKSDELWVIDFVRGEGGSTPRGFNPPCIL